MMTPWLTPAWQALNSLYQRGKMPHAILLSGSAGLGKVAFAQALVKQWLCKHPDTAACGRCSACALVAGGAHPDLQILGDRKAEHPEATGGQGPTTISIDEVRELTEFFSSTAHQQGYKIALLVGADRLSTVAANALLKTLEEPPGKAILLLVADDPPGVSLATVLSRCFRLVIPPVSQTIALPWLQSHYPDIPEMTLKAFLGLAGGAPFAARALLEDEQAKSWNASLAEYWLSDPKKLLGRLNEPAIQQYLTAKPLEALYLLYYRMVDLLLFLSGVEGVLYNTATCKLGEREKYQKKSIVQILFRFVERLQADIEQVSTIPSLNKLLLFHSLFYTWFCTEQMIDQERRA